MSYTLDFIDKQLIFQRITGNYIESEIKEASQKMADFMSQSNQACYVLVDLSKMKAIDSNIVHVKNAVNPLLSHPQLKLILAYGNSDSAVINFLSSFMASIFKIPVKSVSSQAQAIEYLVSQNPTFAGKKLQAALQTLSEQSV